MEFAELLPRLRATVPVVSLAIALDALNSAAVMFCRRSNAYRVTTPGIAAVAGQELYIPTIPADTRICKVVTGTWNARPLVPVSSAIRNSTAPTGRPYFYQLVNQQVRVTDAPTSGDTNNFIFELALEPTITALGMADDFLTEHYQAVIDGAIATLLAMPAQPWSAPQSAGVYEQKFAIAVLHAEARANDDHTPKVRTTSYGGL